MMERTEQSKLYSVLLLDPGWANDGGTETYDTFVAPADPRAAIAEARREAFADSDRDDVDPADFAPLLVTEGHNDALPLDWPRGDDATGSEGDSSRCPRCGGELRATVERRYSLCGGFWVETG